jgi:hypothetical protein
MIAPQRLVVVALGIILSTQSLQGQAPPQYRDFPLGADLTSVSALAGVASSEAKTIHVRPAVIQELEWRPAYYVRGSMVSQTDPVEQIVFSFYNGQLFRLVIDYDRQRTEGMTDGDLIEAISSVYGSPSQGRLPKPSAVAMQNETESGAAIARWGGADYSVGLYRTLYASGFRMIVTSPRVGALAQAADAQAVRLDEREAPQREIARQQKEAEDARLAQEKARPDNKAAFRP